mmetsp:Transcript_89585/g.231220  ORF Transcript_89585/g.231220 Transcript_89585/m.231220 type:complete len:344 (-) Transcript_89585:372-1403(-)
MLQPDGEAGRALAQNRSAPNAGAAGSTHRLWQPGEAHPRPQGARAGREWAEEVPPMQGRGRPPVGPLGCEAPGQQGRGPYLLASQHLSWRSARRGDGLAAGAARREDGDVLRHELRHCCNAGHVGGPGIPTWGHVARPRGGRGALGGARGALGSCNTPRSAALRPEVALRSRLRRAGDASCDTPLVAALRNRGRAPHGDTSAGLRVAVAQRRGCADHVAGGADDDPHGAGASGLRSERRRSSRAGSRAAAARGGALHRVRGRAVHACWRPESGHQCRQEPLQQSRRCGHWRRPRCRVERRASALYGAGGRPDRGGQWCAWQLGNAAGPVRQERGAEDRFAAPL